MSNFYRQIILHQFAFKWVYSREVFSSTFITMKSEHMIQMEDKITSSKLKKSNSTQWSKNTTGLPTPDTTAVDSVPSGNINFF